MSEYYTIQRLCIQDVIPRQYLSSVLSAGAAGIRSGNAAPNSGDPERSLPGFPRRLQGRPVAGIEVTQRPAQLPNAPSAIPENPPRLLRTAVVSFVSKRPPGTAFETVGPSRRKAAAAVFFSAVVGSAPQTKPPERPAPGALLLRKQDWETGR